MLFTIKKKKIGSLVKCFDLFCFLYFLILNTTYVFDIEQGSLYTGLALKGTTVNVFLFVVKCVQQIYLQVSNKN